MTTMKTEVNLALFRTIYAARGTPAAGEGGSGVGVAARGAAGEGASGREGRGVVAGARGHQAR